MFCAFTIQPITASVFLLKNKLGKVAEAQGSNATQCAG